MANKCFQYSPESFLNGCRMRKCGLGNPAFFCQEDGKIRNSVDKMKACVFVRTSPSRGFCRMPWMGGIHVERKTASGQFAGSRLRLVYKKR